MALRVSKNRIALESIPLHLAKSANIASAATVNLATATGNMIHISGTSGPITSLGVTPAGSMFLIIFDSTPTINFNSTSMILNTGGVNYTAIAGDRAIALSEGAGNWIINIIKKDGNSVVVSSGGSNAGTIDVAASRTLLSTDDGKTLNITSSAAITLTVPTGLSAGFACAIYQSSTGAATVLASGVTITPATPGNTKTGGAGKITALVQTSNNAYSFSGGTA